MINGVQQIAEWERVRSTLSHDVLKNEVIPAVSKLERILGGKVIDDEFLESFCERMCPTILSLCDDLRRLTECAEAKLSPKSYFTLAPLKGVDDETKRWLPALVHTLWLNRSEVETRRIKMCFSADAVCQSVVVLTKLWNTQRDRRTTLVKSLLIHLRQMAATVAELGQLVPYHS